MSEKLDKFIENCMSNKILDIYNFFTNKQIMLLEKLDIKLENRKYTINEYDILDGKVRCFFKSKDLLMEKGISKEEYDELLSIINKIAEKYEL